jgi:site-specific recombinase XerD
MRNPNGYGSVVKLSGNRRNPYMARITVGWKESGYPIYKPIGYRKTREEGLILLAEYNGNPYDIDAAKITMQELFDKWEERDFPKMPKKTVNTYRSAFKKHCKSLHKTPYRAIKAFHMQKVINECGLGYSTQGAIRSVFTNLDALAMEMDIIIKKNSDLVHAAAATASSKKPFTDEEINTIWSHQAEPLADTVLFFIYGGWRIGELLTMETENVNLEDHWYKGGSKTEAGKERVVPIHDLIFDAVERRAKESNKYLISVNGNQVSEGKYYKFWNEYMQLCGIADHTTHDGRHTLRSKLDSAGANKVCIDMIMGHKNKDIGERVYTHKTLEELRNALLLVTR